jgi:mono/diheme cytochrome c family protein
MIGITYCLTRSSGNLRVMTCDSSVDVISIQPGLVEGKNIFMKYCLACHQRDGSGVPNMYPPLKKSDWVNGDKNKIIKVLLNGLDADIEVNETGFSQTMPTFNYLTDKQIADVLTYIRQNFENHASEVDANEVSVLRTNNPK